MTSRHWLLQLASFGAVGVAATLTHVAIAWALFEALEWPPALANLAGAATAFFVSFGCNATITFKAARPVASAGWRYAALSLVSYLLATVIMHLVERHDLPGYVFAVMVVLVVPPTTFLLAKFWVFAPGDPQMPCPPGGPSCR